MRVKKQINIEIGERIKAARESVPLTQEVFSELLEVTPQYISDLERGVVGPSLSTLKRTCIVLGVSADQLLFGAVPIDRTQSLAQKCRVLTDEQFDILANIITLYIQGIQTH